MESYTKRHAYIYKHKENCILVHIHDFYVILVTFMVADTKKFTAANRRTREIPPNDVREAMQIRN